MASLYWKISFRESRSVYQIAPVLSGRVTAKPYCERRRAGWSLRLAKARENATVEADGNSRDVRRNLFFNSGVRPWNSCPSLPAVNIAEQTRNRTGEHGPGASERPLRLFKL